ncbi:MAG: glutamate-1-semialdehyde 2,1-aminomutase [Conexivisphaerales archaeon]
MSYYKRALRVMPGGVSSPVRAFGSVSGKPIFFSKGSGSRLIDVDNNSYIDYCCSWGALILGHANPEVTRAVTDAVMNGTSFGAPCESELLLAERICSIAKNIERIRFVNSGTEATMSAIRLARAYTSRKKILKFAGCYHGHADHFLSQAGSGMASLGIPSSAGIPEEVVSNTITVPYNDLESVRSVFEENGKDIAAVIVEPVAGNMGVIPPREGFLEGLREFCDKHSSLLIFDEVITGFRITLGGAQSLYKIDADVVCYGKIIGGGLPVGAYGGRNDIMRLVAPEGPVYQAGTLSGNPVAMAAGLTTLNLLGDSVYQRLEVLSSSLQRRIEKVAEEARIDITINRVGSMLGIFFTKGPVSNYEDAKKSNSKLFSTSHRILLQKSVYLPPSPMESLFISSSHSDHDIKQTADAFYDAFRVIKNERVSRGLQVKGN